MPNSDLNAVVAQRIELSPGLMILRVVPDGWSLPEFEPGQFAVLGVPASFPRCAHCLPEAEPVDPEAMIKRAYSIGSSNRDRLGLEFYISLVEAGGLTPRLFALKVGDKLHLSAKLSGKFTLEDVPEDQDLLLLSTGTGVTPYVSMLRSLDFEKSQRRVAVVHGVRNSWDLGYRAELEAMARFQERITYLPIISRPKGEFSPWEGAVGYAQEFWTKGILEKHWKRMPTAQDCHVFLCGNPAMIDDAVAVLEKDGFQTHSKRNPGTIHLEKYW